MASGDFTKLRPRQRKYLAGLAQGLSKREALRAAQYSENTAPSRVENASVKAAFARIVRRAVPAHVLAQVIAEGQKASRPPKLNSFSTKAKLWISVKLSPGDPAQASPRLR